MVTLRIRIPLPQGRLFLLKTVNAAYSTRTATIVTPDLLRKDLLMFAVTRSPYPRVPVKFPTSNTLSAPGSKTRCTLRK